jgi:hypothetical protein
LMSTLRLAFAWTVAALATFMARMRRAGLRVAAACFAGRRLRRGWFVFRWRHPMVEVD